MFGIRSGVILTYDITPNTKMATTATNTVNGFFTLKEVMEQDPFRKTVISYMIAPCSGECVNFH